MLLSLVLCGQELNSVAQDLVREKLQFHIPKATDNGVSKKEMVEKSLMTKSYFSKERKIEINEKRKNTNLLKYGVDNVLCLPEIREKIKQTNLEKYGVDNVLRRPEIREKIKKVNFT